ncbi:MAG: hypothetical protein LUP97_03390 [Methanoregula sp.]|jgi:hypothetical protein|nr:hypothetical protein [Methanoregula sp.]WML67537.1 MAG: hypothetical protein METHP_01076 [Methanoregula sp. SKADARSKE-2]
MEKIAAWGALPGSSTAEKFLSLGIERRRTIEIRMLDDIARSYGVQTYLFFEPDLAKERTLESLQAEYRDVSEYERPFISVGSFLKFTRENDPSFDQTLKEFPLMVEIVSAGEMAGQQPGKTVPYVTGLMPFLDEFDVDAEPPRTIG